MKITDQNCQLNALLENQIFRNCLAPFNCFYGAGAYLHLLSYQSGLKKRHSSPAFVVSVGNLTVGGTGKTPIVMELGRRYVEKGLRTAVLSRGYGRRSKGNVIVSRGQGPLATVQDSGDEPFLIASLVDGLGVLVGSRRVELAELACRELAAQVLILDDGFQHLPLHRNLDIVLWDAGDDPERQALLPGGRLREPLTALGRADHVIITKVDSLDRFEYLKSKLAKYSEKANFSACYFRPFKLRNARDQIVELDVPVISLCAIARPESFAASLRSLNLDLIKSYAFPDHHWFSEQELEQIFAFAEETGTYVVTTAKDMVRIKEYENSTRLSSFFAAGRVLYLAQAVEWLTDLPSFLSKEDS
ncbi:MAG: tetraacyldisaccharide 4'-kinase [Candidatus Obscuribacterales bacterium]|nr:tetraacyldisaccharide 4'-kinase [Candidatus Obscuribacterales bacterium]